MNIADHILANEVLREVKALLPTPCLQSELEIQTAKGLAKYPNLVNVDDYNVPGWIKHNVQELIDSTVYYKATIKRIMKDYDVKNRSVHERVIALLEKGIRQNVEQLQVLEMLKNHYTEEQPNEPHSIDEQNAISSTT